MLNSKDKYLTGEEIKSVVCDGESQEVSITFDKKGIAHMYVSYNPWITKMRKKVEEDPETFKCKCAGYNSKGEPTGYFFKFPAKLVNIRKKSTMAEEKRNAVGERFKKSRSKQ